jgi:hypothetical protein
MGVSIWARGVCIGMLWCVEEGRGLTVSRCAYMSWGWSSICVDINVDVWMSTPRFVMPWGSPVRDICASALSPG